MHHLRPGTKHGETPKVRIADQGNAQPQPVSGSANKLPVPKKQFGRFSLVLCEQGATTRRLSHRQIDFSVSFTRQPPIVDWRLQPG
eukprot:COSAG02_NODE_1034_length_15056_cov_2.888948_6_plen_86_part_00